VEDLLFERGIDRCHETFRLRWNRFGPMFAAEIRRKRLHHMRQFTERRWHLDEVFVRINGQMHYLWRAVDHEGKVLESFVSKGRDKTAALKFIKNMIERHERSKTITTDGPLSYGAALKALGARGPQETGRWKTTQGRDLSSADPATRTREAEVPENGGTAKRCRSAPATVHNPLNPKRQLVTRDIFRPRRSAA
jgi:putative transposase